MKDGSSARMLEMPCKVVTEVSSLLVYPFANIKAELVSADGLLAREQANLTFCVLTTWANC